MRSDMHKVIVERPRVGRATAFADKTGARIRPVDPGDLADYDSGPRRQLHPARDKSFNEHLSPLERFLQGQVGRPWDKVHSEIVARIDRRSTIGNHVMQHVPHFVAIDTYLHDGVVYERGCRYHRTSPVRGLYVDPVTGILRRARPRRRLESPAPAPSFYLVEPGRGYRNIDGLWYEVRFQWVKGAAPKDPPRAELVEKRQCGRKLVRRIEAGEFGPGTRWPGPRP